MQIISPLKKKMNISLNTSRDGRTSLQEVITSQTEQIVKSNQLEQELHRVNQQRKLLIMELDDLSNKYVEKSEALQECELENALLRRQVQDCRKQDDNSKLHSLLQQIFIKSRQKNQIILEWTKKFEIMEKRLENEKNQEQHGKQLQFQNEMLKQQLSELKQSQLILSKNYLELKEERNQYYRQFIDQSQAFQKLDIKHKQLEIERNLLQSELMQFKQDGLAFKEQISHVESMLKKKNKWKSRYHELLKESQENQKESSSESMVEQLKAEVQNGCNEKELNENYNNEELNDMKDKLQQLEQENLYLREQNIELQNQFQSATDRLLKQQLQSSMTKEQSQTFSFVQYHHEYCDSLEQQRIQD
ncbi:unnamed protein product (macronuclear) [Paramecium tetraurelia]|uniref:Uncharacterized protein n=1 Tax=Paramecium tetraurelia TaxID=5888 RepID=A0BTM3_PARTE|nr:uncharacterized protein GSPATT00032122001 [Paramecium tetraurelia]CAK61890.1 unnamed protein product [Paramecium tetraurelia]|eukprot:XP_001429288.1 hypothetical protein (macronuclear) [Paramecium tetraurelia strain d4-2]